MRWRNTTRATLRAGGSNAAADAADVRQRDGHVFEVGADKGGMQNAKCKMINGMRRAGEADGRVAAASGNGLGDQLRQRSRFRACLGAAKVKSFGLTPPLV